jgi:hypothetical protein
MFRYGKGQSLRRVMTLYTANIFMFTSLPRNKCLFYDLGVCQDMAIPTEELGPYVRNSYPRIFTVSLLCRE